MLPLIFPHENDRPSLPEPPHPFDLLQFVQVPPARNRLQREVIQRLEDGDVRARCRCAAVSCELDVDV